MTGSSLVMESWSKLRPGPITAGGGAMLAWLAAGGGATNCGGGGASFAVCSIFGCSTFFTSTFSGFLGSSGFFSFGTIKTARFWSFAPSTPSCAAQNAPTATIKAWTATAMVTFVLVAFFFFRED